MSLKSTSIKGKMTPKPIDFGAINSGTKLLTCYSFIFWHPKQPDQFKEKVADVFHIPNIVYMADGKLIPKITYELDKHHAQGHLYTLI